MGLIALNMNAIEQGLSQYAQKHPDQQELIAELRSEITAHKPKILLILANLNDKIVTKTGDQPEKPIAQSLALNKKGILVASIGDLTGLLSGSYENIYYYINDHLGTPQMLTDQNAIVVWQADYDPFGKATVNDDPDGNGTHVTNNIRFPGQYYDQETGLHYNYHRYYDPGIGRMLSPDPSHDLHPTGDQIQCVVPFLLETPQELHAYVYVQNNPLNNKDPQGLQTCHARDACIENAVNTRKACTRGAWASEGICLSACAVGCATVPGYAECFLPCAAGCHLAFKTVRITCWTVFFVQLHTCYAIKCEDKCSNK